MDYVGKYCIVRARNAGVHAGIVESIDSLGVHLRDSRRLWYWRVPVGAPALLSGVAIAGLSGDSKVSAPVDWLLVAAGDWCEVLPVSEAAEKSIRESPAMEREQ